MKPGQIYTRPSRRGAAVGMGALGAGYWVVGVDQTTVTDQDGGYVGQLDSQGNIRDDNGALVGVENGNGTVEVVASGQNIPEIYQSLAVNQPAPGGAGSGVNITIAPKGVQTTAGPAPGVAPTGVPAGASINSFFNQSLFKSGSFNLTVGGVALAALLVGGVGMVTGKRGRR